MGRACTRNAKKRNMYRLLVGELEGRSRRRWMDNIKIDLGEIGGGVLTALVWFRIGTSG
jgi:hypothetical protein